MIVSRPALSIRRLHREHCRLDPWRVTSSRLRPRSPFFAPSPRSPFSPSSYQRDSIAARSLKYVSHCRRNTTLARIACNCWHQVARRRSHSRVRRGISTLRDSESSVSSFRDIPFATNGISRYYEQSEGLSFIFQAYFRNASCNIVNCFLYKDKLKEIFKFAHGNLYAVYILARNLFE